MSDIEMVVAALMAGLSTGVASTTSTAVQDACAALRKSVRQLLSRRSPGDEDVLDELDTAAADPADLRQRLTEALIEADVAGDESVLTAARRVQDLVGPFPHVNVQNSQAVQVGNFNVQENNTFHFGPQPDGTS